MAGRFITFEGTVGCGKSTQLRLLAERLAQLGHPVCPLREPGGTPIGEEIRHTLQHSQRNQAMTPETELLLLNASRAQLVREVIRPALAAGQIVLCDRFYDSTTVYQGYGRGLDLAAVQAVIDFAVGDTRPDLTFLFTIPLELSEARRQSRRAGASAAGASPLRDRMEEADRAFFARVERGYRELGRAAGDRVCAIDGAGPVDAIAAEVWRRTERLLGASR